jgi:hypothetical protein
MQNTTTYEVDSIKQEICYDKRILYENCSTEDVVPFVTQPIAALTSEHVQELDSMCQLSRTKQEAMQSKITKYLISKIKYYNN